MTLAGLPDRAWAIFFARLVLGLIFGMAGWGKVFKMGPAEHTRRFFVDPFASSWIPMWILRVLGLSIPFVELVSGWLVFVGLFTNPALIALGCVLVIVTYGHLLQNFLYELHIHVIPRLALLVFLLVMSREGDILSLDHLLRRY
jgi:thiosulfate dehydrogenase [quinone] large subunit